ncbi:MAG: pre-peptidase C-terminal domain-containing protein, partial [Sulfurovum sp.]|nr:pre-peptidase C-terminal domain-containing protein [Sulfurovum sp.]
QIGYDNNSGTGTNFKISQYLETGTYYIKVAHHSTSGTGSYTLASQFTPDDYGDDRSTATSITSTSTTSGRIDGSRDVDYFEMSITSAGTLVVETTGSTDTVGILYNASGTQIGYDNNSGTDNNFKISKKVVAGTYYVRVSASSSGNYGLVYHVTADDHGDTKETATSITPTRTTSGNLETAGDEDWFKVVIPSAGRLVAETNGTTDTEGELYDVSGRNRIAYDDQDGVDNNFKISKFITTAGTYYVRVKHHSATETGPYSLVVHFDDHNNTQDGATPINPTSTTPGSFEIAGDEDWFKIIISRAGVLEVETTGRIDTNGILYDASGTQIASNENSGTGNNFKITQTVTARTYYVKVKHHSTSGTGDYSLVSRFTPSITTTSPESISDDHGNTKETATLIELNTTTQKSTTSGNIEVAADKDYFEINITRAGKLVIRTTGTTDTYGYLYDASGTQVASDDNSGFSNNNF